MSSAPGTRARVLAAAADLVTENGSEGLGVVELARRSGVSNGSIYHHFGSREGVLTALLVEVIEGYQQTLLDALAEHPDNPLGGVRAVIAAHMIWTETHRGEARLLLDSRQHLACQPAIQALNDRFRTATECWLREQDQAGRLPPVPIDIGHALVFAPALELTRLWLTGRRPSAPSTYIDDLARAAHAALLSLPASAKDAPR